MSDKKIPNGYLESAMAHEKEQAELRGEIYARGLADAVPDTNKLSVVLLDHFDLRNSGWILRGVPYDLARAIIVAIKAGVLKK